MARQGEEIYRIKRRKAKRRKRLGSVIGTNFPPSCLKRTAQKRQYNYAAQEVGYFLLTDIPEEVAEICKSLQNMEAFPPIKRRGEVLHF